MASYWALLRHNLEAPVSIKAEGEVGPIYTGTKAPPAPLRVMLLMLISLSCFFALLFTAGFGSHCLSSYSSGSFSSSSSKSSGSESVDSVAKLSNSSSV